MMTEKELKLYGVKSVSLMSEATFTPKLIITYLDGKESSLSMSREEVEDIKAQSWSQPETFEIKAQSWSQPETFERKLKKHLDEHRKLERKKKLEKISEAGKML